MSFIARHKLALALGMLVLGGLSWVVYAVLHNASRRLNAERLQKHRDLWSAHGLKNYRLQYRIRLRDNEAWERFDVRVTAGKAIEASYNGKDVPEKRLHDYGMDRLFDYIERFLELDEKEPTRKAVHYADFSAADGRLLRYQRHLPGQSVEIVVETLNPE